MLRNLAAAVALGLLLTGCISSQSHPDRWAKVEPQQSGCGGIAGLYQDAGESAAAGKRRGVQISRLLLGQPLNEPPMSHVQIAYADEALTIRAYRDGAVAAEKTYTATAGDLRCNADGVSIDGQFGLVGPAQNLLMVGAGGSTITLRRLSDGALLLRSSGHVVALVFLVPMVAGETELYRFATL